MADDVIVIADPKPEDPHDLSRFEDEGGLVPPEEEEEPAA